MSAWRLKRKRPVADNDINGMNIRRLAMEKADDVMVALFQEKLLLYQELAELMKQEKKQIVGADVASLWKMSEKKQRLAEDIEKNRSRILDAATAVSIDHGMTPRSFQAFRFLSLLPAEQRRRLSGAASLLLTLKKEIRTISVESKQYIESKLGMIDELISIMTGREHRSRGYGATSIDTRSGSPMLFQKEV
jgi:flagellar biosynthesis/type III secretory pathway chaperone